LSCRRDFEEKVPKSPAVAEPIKSEAQRLWIRKIPQQRIGLHAIPKQSDATVLTAAFLIDPSEFQNQRQENEVHWPPVDVTQLVP
jgi:hypothetical protein